MGQAVLRRPTLTRRVVAVKLGPPLWLCAASAGLVGLACGKLVGSKRHRPVDDGHRIAIGIGQYRPVGARRDAHQGVVPGDRPEQQQEVQQALGDQDVEQELEHNIQYGDASELWVLERAGIQRADMVIAVTGDDSPARDATCSNTRGSGF